MRGVDMEWKWSGPTTKEHKGAPTHSFCLHAFYFLRILFFPFPFLPLLFV
jgi:hypothetical protein